MKLPRLSVGRLYEDNMDARVGTLTLKSDEAGDVVGTVESSPTRTPVSRVAVRQVAPVALSARFRLP